MADWEQPLREVVNGCRPCPVDSAEPPRPRPAGEKATRRGSHRRVSSVGWPPPPPRRRFRKAAPRRWASTTVCSRSRRGLPAASPAAGGAGPSATTTPRGGRSQGCHAATAPSRAAHASKPWRLPGRPAAARADAGDSGGLVAAAAAKMNELARRGVKGTAAPAQSRTRVCVRAPREAIALRSERVDGEAASSRRLLLRTPCSPWASAHLCGSRLGICLVGTFAFLAFLFLSLFNVVNPKARLVNSNRKLSRCWSGAPGRGVDAG
eukprot:359900-Chlamydomonas_euryale.AAC.6